ncbi:MAG: family 31 glucosidase [Clostridiales bacterium]|nr:family 31 glucosidase [Clostridiales bacterium]
MFAFYDSAVERKYGGETVRVEAWGEGLRVRAVPVGKIPDEAWALDIDVPKGEVEIHRENPVFIRCGKIKCVIDGGGHLSFFMGERLLFEEARYPWALRETAREYRPRQGGEGFALDLQFEAYDDESIHGMGQYRDAKYEVKGEQLEMAQRNSQISVPFFLSSRGYGFLWNSPAVGYAAFGTNRTTFHTDSTNKIDYWVTADEEPKRIIEKYTDVIGHPSPLPESTLGLWQCKLRYRTQDEVLEVAREYKRRGIIPDVIVIDFFHWIYQGDWDFDPDYWPDPKAMTDELSDMGIRTMVSVWPTFDPRSKNFREFEENGYFVKADRGLDVAFDFNGYSRLIDSTNPEAREAAYALLRKNYGKYGIDMFWLDEAEPEVTKVHPDHYRYWLGSAAEVGNIYPRLHSKMVYDGQSADGVGDILNLVRSAWVGSARFGALVWSGDIESSFREMKVQIVNGINMGIAGIPYWISDTGGFYSGNVNDPVFRELLVRWYEWACFCPVLRMHGDRLPSMGSLVHGTDRGGGFNPSGAPNELWSYGEDMYEIFVKYLKIREGIKPYIKKTADEAAATGVPMIRAMFLEFPDDEVCRGLGDQYMFGSDYLVAPVTDYGARERRVYLPAGEWESVPGGELISSAGEYITAAAPLDKMPVYKRR